MNQLEYIAQTVANYPGMQAMFTDALQIKASPHRPVFSCHGASIGPDGVYLMDNEGEWHGPLQESQAFGPLVISSVYQRLKVMELNRASVVVAEYDPIVNATIIQ